MFARQQEIKGFDVVDGVMPPQNLEVEEIVLGGIMLDPNAMVRIKDVLPAQAFYSTTHREIYETAVRSHQDGKPTDFMAMVVALSDKGILERVGGRNKLVTALDNTVSAVNIDAMAAIIVEKWQRRKMIALGNKIVRMGHDKTECLSDLVEVMQKDVFEFSVSATNDGGDNIHVSEVAYATYQEVEELANTGEIPTTMTGFYDFDSITGGLEGGQLMLIAARPGVGKSALAQDIAYHVSTACQKPVLFYSLEMTRKQLGRRMAAKIARIELNYLRSGRLSQSQWADFARGTEEIASSKLYLNDKSDIDMAQVKSSIRKTVLQSGECPALIVFDYLQLLAGSNDDDAQIYQKVTKTSRQLKQLALELNIPVIALSQLSRACESRDNKRPRLSDLRESGALEQDADIVSFLYRDEMYNPDSTDRGIAEWNIAKQRDGATGTIKLLFDGQFTQFKNLARKY